MPFLDQYHGLTPFQKRQFFEFKSSCSSTLERQFFVQYRKKHFSALFCPPKKVGKTAISGPKPWVNLFGKMSIFRLFKLLVFIAQKSSFFVLEYRKRHLSGQYYLKKSWKMVIFEPKPWFNPFLQYQFFEFFNFLF